MKYFCSTCGRMWPQKRPNTQMARQNRAKLTGNTSIDKRGYRQVHLNITACVRVFPLYFLGRLAMEEVPFGSFVALRFSSCEFYTQKVCKQLPMLMFDGKVGNALKTATLLPALTLQNRQDIWFLQTKDNELFSYSDTALSHKSAICKKTLIAKQSSNVD